MAAISSHPIAFTHTNCWVEDGKVSLFGIATVTVREDVDAHVTIIFKRMIDDVRMMTDVRWLVAMGKYEGAFEKDLGSSHRIGGEHRGLSLIHI